MCYYDTVASHISSTSIMPYLLLTDDYVINISYDISCATISDSRQYVELYSHTFDSLVKKSAPMLTTAHNVPIKQFSNLLAAHGPMRYSISYDSHLVPFMSQKLRNKYQKIIPEQMLPWKDGMKTTYFTEAGLDRFLQTGIFPKMYQDFFSPLNMTDRYNLFKKMYDMALKDTFQPILIHSEVFNIPEHLSVLAFQNAVIFIFRLSSGESSICTVEEKSLIYAFHDFFKYLTDSNIVLSPEETMAILKDKLDNVPKDDGG